MLDLLDGNMMLRAREIAIGYAMTADRSETIVRENVLTDAEGYLYFLLNGQCPPEREENAVHQVLRKKCL